MFNGFMLEKIV